MTNRIERERGLPRAPAPSPERDDPSVKHTPMVLRIAVPAPLRQYFDYLPCEGDTSSDKRPAPGVRVRVPFGKRELVGVLVSEQGQTDVIDARLRPAHAVLDQKPLIPEKLMALCEWAASYYQHPPGDVFSSALPPALRAGRELPQTAWTLTDRGLGLPEGALKRAPSQAQALALLQGGPQLQPTLQNEGVSSATLRELAKKTLIERCAPPVLRASDELREPGPTLSDEQHAMLARIPSTGFHIQLLEGITGSGKTEIYLQLIAQCLRRGEQALVLIPEIGLTPQTLARFAARFRAPIAVLNSGLSDGQRLAAWQSAQTGNAGIVIGTRSAVFTPMARLGLIVVDEEHDPSFKQQDGFRYSARDVAVKRAQLENCPAVLGSATPAMESLLNAERKRYAHLRLQHRQGGGAPPVLSTIDLRGRALQGGISEALLQALKETTEVKGQQALLFLNRRGYAPTLQCHSCGWIAGCSHCDARLTVHLRKRRLRCHHCGAQQHLPTTCPECGAAELLTRGLGTEQTEGYLARALDCPVHRVDSDSMRGRDAMQTLIDIAHSGEPCVMLGTQMLSKGHHFPAVQLVGIVDADALLFSADFRGEERMAQLIMQVAGRAGRESAGGAVLVQTHYPDDAIFTALRNGDYPAIARTQLGKRAAAGLPPYGHLCMVRADAPAEFDGERFLSTLRRDISPKMPADVRLIGPLPSSLPRRAGQFRWQLWCLANDRRTARRAATCLVEVADAITTPRSLSWFIDVDPLDVA